MLHVAAARDVWKSYRTAAADVQALRGVSFEVAPGQFVALTGASGSGKSTLLNLLACVDVPTSGTISIAGRDTGALSDDGLTALRRSSIGYVFQFFNLMPTMTVRENIELPLLLAGWSHRRSAPAVDKALQEIEMSELGGRRPAQLSGGQQQRVAIARALVHDPPLVLADEPTGNLDSQTGAAILVLLQRSCSARRAAILIATHSDEAASKADRILRLRDGVLLT
ncbi:MAG: ABC transporter ATP-binding protein [Candidatus Eremiobacteraeota bacterium]|nr:ABC transporter ATP-binding protein [Candidatus Eremiobacteraeota bacterium]